MAPGNLGAARLYRKSAWQPRTQSRVSCSRTNFAFLEDFGGIRAITTSAVGEVYLALELKQQRLDRSAVTRQLAGLSSESQYAATEAGRMRISGRSLLPAVVFVACILPMRLEAAPSTEPANSDSNRMAAIRSLRLLSLPGAMPTFYGTGAEARAKYLQGVLGGEIAFYSEQFRVVLSPVTMAVLDRKQWPKVASPSPYGMPSVDGTSPAVFVMPASWDGVEWMVVPRRSEVPAPLLRRALATGKKWDQVKFEGCDGIGTHEIGHSIIRQLGIEPQTKWFNEFLASYAGYAYLKAVDPGQALSNEIFWIVGLRKSPHKFTRLDDFEARYDELQEKYPANYGWYQLALDQRVMEVYKQQRLGFLHQIQMQFRQRDSTLSSTEVLDKLEAISPGWKAWSARLGADNLTAIGEDARQVP